MGAQYNIAIAKFGGSSLETVSRMLRCAQIVVARPHIRLVVLSATGGTTDQLLQIACFASEGQWMEAQSLLKSIRSRHLQMAAELNCESVTSEQILELFEEAGRLAHGMQLLKEASPRVLDQLLSIGERGSSLLFLAALRHEGASAEVLDARQVLCTSDNYGKAEPQIEAIAARGTDLLLPRLRQGELLVTQGFIGATPCGSTTTLGRGGSDYTAALLGEALGVSHIEIWTDVPGIASGDPRIIHSAVPIKEISFSEAAELATFGAKVLHPSTLWPAIRNNLPVFVGSSQEPEAEGTWIRREVEASPDVRAISVRRAQLLLTVHSLSMLRRPGFLARVFSVLAEHKISVDLVTTSEVRVSLTIDEPDRLDNKVLDALGSFAHVEVEKGLALVAVIGNRATSTPGIARSVFETIKNNVRLICHGASPHNLCFLVDDAVSVEVACRLHKELIEGERICV